MSEGGVQYGAHFFLTQCIVERRSVPRWMTGNHHQGHHTVGAVNQLLVLKCLTVLTLHRIVVVHAAQG